MTGLMDWCLQNKSSWGVSDSEWREDLQYMIRVQLDCEIPTRDSSSKPTGFSVGMTGLGGLILFNSVFLRSKATWGSPVGTSSSPRLCRMYSRFLVETLWFLCRNDKVGGVFSQIVILRSEATWGSPVSTSGSSILRSINCRFLVETYGFSVDSSFRAQLRFTFC